MFGIPYPNDASVEMLVCLADCVLLQEGRVDERGFARVVTLAIVHLNALLCGRDGSTFGHCSAEMKQVW